MKEILKCIDVSKNIGNKKILSNIDLSINEGDILGFIGRNGSGKTTLIKLILSLQHKTSGKIYINNYDIDINFDKAIKYVGSVVENPDFYMYMSGMKNLLLKARIYNVNIERVKEIVEMVSLTNKINNKVSTYSLGERQRLGIAYALLNDPKLLLLDEPTNGLDIEGINDLRNILFELSKNNIAILLSSHMLSEIDSMCNKICIIKDGNIINKSNINELKVSTNTFIFEVSDTSNIDLLFDNIIISNNIFKVTCNKEFIPVIVESLVKDNIRIYSIIEEIVTLEDAYLKKVGDFND